MNIMWIKAVSMRVIKTIVQYVNWKMVLSASFLADILSLLTSVIGLPEINNTKDGDL